MRLIVTLSALLALIAFSCEEQVMPEAPSTDLCQHEGVVIINDCGPYVRLTDGKAIYVTNDRLDAYTQGTQLLVGFSLITSSPQASTSSGDCGDGCGSRNHSTEQSQTEENSRETCMAAKGIQKARIFCSRPVSEETK